jgi:5-methyltetrahydrofolate--homocysteine methyltransferase
MGSTLLETLARRPLLCDGAMGTELLTAGLEPGACGDAWNLDHPDKVLAIQRRYVQAGADCLLTNTFGACRIALGRHGRAGDAAAINRTAVRIARLAFGGRSGFVIGDVGPFGGLLEPYGEFTQEQVRAAFAEQAAALMDGGADAIIIETQSALEELALGIEAARAAGAPCIIGSMAFNGTGDNAFHTMMGVTPQQAATFMAERGVDIVALNCGSGMDVVRAALVLKQYRTACDLPLMAQPNAGQPETVEGRLVYRQTPESMAAGIPGLLAAGARIVGGCCGTTSEHIRLFRQKIDAHLAEAGV